MAFTPNLGLLTLLDASTCVPKDGEPCTCAACLSARYLVDAVKDGQKRVEMAMKDRVAVTEKLACKEPERPRRGASVDKIAAVFEKRVQALAGPDIQAAKDLSSLLEVYAENATSYAEHLVETQLAEALGMEPPPEPVASNDVLIESLQAFLERLLPPKQAGRESSDPEDDSQADVDSSPEVAPGYVYKPYVPEVTRLRSPAFERGPETWPALRERAANRPLVLVAGVRMNPKLVVLKRRFEFDFEWLEIHPHSPRDMESAAAQVRTGKFGGVLYCQGMASHSSQTLIQNACKTSDTPFAYAWRAGVGDMQKALDQLEQQLGAQATG